MTDAQSVATLVNLTPHRLVVFHDDLRVVDLPACDHPARVVEVIRPADPLLAGAVPVPRVLVESGHQIEGLPEPTAGTWFVVSRITAAAARHRADLLFPAQEVRDSHGVIIGCAALGSFGGRVGESPDA